MNWLLRNSILLIFGLVCLASAAVKPIPDDQFDPKADAIAFRKASNKQEHANRLFLARSQKQRALIQKEYKSLYNREMFAKDTGIIAALFDDEYGDLLHAMSTPLTREFAMNMFQDSKPVFALPTALIDAMATLSNELWQNIRIFRDNYESGKPFYIKYFKTEWAHFQDMVDAVSEGKRNESTVVDVVAAKKDAEFLNKIVGIPTRGKDWVKDEHDVRDIFAYRSFGHIRRICRQYKALYNRRLLEDIQKHLFEDEHVKDAIMAIIRVRMDAPSYFAERLFETMDGPGTKERDLNRIIISRSTIDMDEIKKAFQKKYGRSLASMIEEDTSGNYRKLLLAMIA